MVRYEIKKVFGSAGSRVALIFLSVMVAVNCWTATNAYGTSWINEHGDEENGLAAVAKLRSAQKAWSGPLDTERLTAALRENQRIEATPEAQSRDTAQNDIAYGWKQGIAGIRDVVNGFLAEDFHEYDYYLMDSISENALAGMYDNRVKLLRDWLYEENSNAFHHYSEEEKTWLITQFQALETPMYYTYYEGWKQASENSMMLTMFCSMILGYLVAGIFANEFKWKSDAIYFSTALGRTANTKAKIMAGFLLVTVVYWACMLIYSLYTLCYLGFDGWNCAVQLDHWKCFYNITFLEKYLLILLGGYLGNLFSAFTAMWISSKTRTAVIAVTMPFLSIFIPTLLQNYEGISIEKVLGLLPNRLLEINYALNYYDVYSVGKMVIGAIPILFVLYLIVTLAFLPAMYREFGGKEIY